jgi:predicted ATPase/DNA-binding winged helix-turn-helix (wHTH) protein
MLYHFDTFTLDTQRYELRHAGQPIPLEPQVFKVLAYLVQHADRVVLREELFERLWPGQYVSDDALGRCIRKARQVFGEHRGVPRFIKTIPRHGYHFIAPVTVQASDVPTSGTLTGAPSLSPAVNAPHVALLQSPPTTLVFDEEYKQVTVLCGVVPAVSAASTHVAHETRYRLLQACYAALHELVRQYAGTVLSFGDEGFQALFGAPMAQEDHARRAVIVALEFRQALREITTTLMPPTATGLAVRMGAHTGMVVVGHLGGAAPQPYTAVGDTNIAMQLRDMAAAGMLLISDTTARFVEGIVHVETYGTLEVATLPTPLPVWRVDYRLPTRPVGFGHGTRTLSRFVGRARELAILNERIERAAGGHGQAIAIAGEPGIGKSRLLHEFQRSLPAKLWRYYEGHCLSYGSATPYLPVLDLLRQLCGITESDTPDRISTTVHQALQHLDMTSDEHIPYLLHLLGCTSDMAHLTHLSPQARRARTFATLRQVMLRMSRHHPVVLAVENLHWIDATSEEFLASLVDSLGGASLVLVATYRSGYRPAWLDKSYATQLALPGLGAQESLAVVQSVPQTARIPIAVQQAMVQTARGNPFFLEELAWALVEQGGDASPPAVPATVQAVLAARMDRLSPSAKRLLQTAAIIGHAVPLVLLAAIADDANDAELLQSLEQLQSAEFLYETQVGSEQTYAFKHALTQEVAYGSLLQVRRQTLHARVAEVLTTRFPETVATHPALLAQHYTAAGLHAQAIHYWHTAGQQALERSANAEAVAHLRTGLELLKALPETTEHVQHELVLHLALGAALIATQGYAASAVEQTYTRARHLCQYLEDPRQLFPVLRGLWNFYFVRAEYQTAHELAEQLLPLAYEGHDPAVHMAAHRALGSTLFGLGHFAAALTHLEQGIALYHPQQHRSHAFLYGEDTGAVCLIRAAWALWLLGYPHQALARLHEAVRLAQDIGHPFSLAFAWADAAIVHQHRREAQAVQTCAEATIKLARDHGFAYWLAFGTIMRGWSLAIQGLWAEGHAQLHGGLDAWRATGSGNSGPYFLTLLVEAQRQAGQSQAGLTVLTEALTLVDTTGERWYEAELYRLKGELLLQHTGSNASQAEPCFQHALAIARRQQAKSLELRAAMSLARLWQQQGKRQEAHDLLAPVYHWFTEGFDTADLQDAKALLEELAG